MESNCKGGRGGQKVHAYFFNGPGNIDLKNIALRYWWLWGHLCSSILDQKGLSYSKKQENYYPNSSFPPPPLANSEPIFSMKFQQMVNFYFRGGRGGLRKMVITFHFLATLKFIYGPLLENVGFSREYFHILKVNISIFTEIYQYYYINSSWLMITWGHWGYGWRLVN